jgi:hypothetical protein
VCCGINGGHPSLAEDGVEVPLTEKGFAEPLQNRVHVAT